MPANLPASPAPVPAEALAPSASDWWRPAARARVSAPAAWSPAAECPVCAEPPSKIPPRPAAVTLATPDAKVKPPPRPRGRARSRPRRSTTQLMSQASASPASNPDFQAATGQIRVEALRQRTHPLALRKRTEVEKSAKLEVKVQEDQSAKDRNAIKMGEVGAEQLGASRNFSAAGFKADLKKRVESKPPKSEENAKKLAKSDAVQHFEQDFSKGLATEQGKVTGPLNQQASGDPKKAGFEAGVQAVPIPKPVYPPRPGPVDPSLVVPKAKPDPEVSLQQESDRLSGAMQHNRLSDDQLEQSREPSFLKTLKAKQDAQQKIGEARIEYRRQEAATLQGATAQANQSLSTSLTGMSRTHTRAGGRVAGGQKDTESKTQKRQREIKQTIDEIYERTAGCVKCTLETLTKKVTEDFTRSLKNETDTFNSRVRDRLDSYYSTGKKVKHFLLGEPKVVVNDDGSVRDLRKEDWDMSSFPPRIITPWINPQVYKIFLEEKDLFIAKMDVQLDAIARDVQTGLTTANNQIQAGKDAVTSYIKTLRGEEQRFAKGLEEDVLMKFENLEGTIDDAREDLLATLADQYRESINQLETTFNDINDELKKTWIDRAVEFIETVGKTIFQLAELLFSILKRIAYLVWDIIKHPIRFFETLVAGLKQGISDFIGDIGTHLKEAFWTWLTDATPGKTIRVSLGSGVAGLFDLVMQVLNLGRPELRAIVDKVLGPEFMQMVDKGEAFAEKAFEPVVILFTKGPVAFWDYIKEQLEEIIKSSFDRIKESVFLAFVKKGILWIAGFFVPGGGFVKIVKAIVRAFQFVAENLDRIRLFFDSVFDSMEAATQGNPAGVASKIVTGLKMGIVLALGFLAKQIGLDAIIDSVHKILHALRRPIVNAIEWILRKVKPLVDKIVATAKKLYGKVVGKADQETEQSKAVKQKVRTELTGQRISDAQQASRLISSLYGKYRREGLKGIRVLYNAAAPGVASIRVSASIPEIVAQLPLTSVTEAKALRDFVTTFHFLAGGTTLYVYYDIDNKTYPDSPIHNLPGGAHGQHAEAIFASQHISKLRSQIEDDRRNGRLKTRAGQPVKVELNLNRITCPRCAAILAEVASANRDMAFIVKAASVSNEAKFRVHATWIADLIEAGVVVEPLGIWPEIQKKFVELATKMGKGEVAFRGESGNFLEFMAAARKIQEGLSREHGVAVLIDMAKELLEQKKKGSKKDLANVPPLGTDV
jgi:hypothetical protein